MMKRIFFSVAVAVLYSALPHISFAAQDDTSKTHRILILLNGSANMASAWQGTTRYETAAAFITGLADSMYERNATIEIGMGVYGGQYSAKQQRCNDYRREAPFERDNRTRLELRLADIKPKGQGSFSYAIAQALKNEITDTGKYHYSIIVVSDSSTYCGSDNCFAQAGIPLCKTYFAGIGAVPMYNCYDRVFQLTDGDAVVQTIHKILPDFPALVQEGEYWGRNRQVVQTTPRPAPTAEATLPRATSAEVSIVRGNQLYTITLYRREQGVFVKMEELFFYGEKVKKMKLPFGNYKASYYIDTKEIAQEFVVTEGSTVDVLLD